MWIALVPAFLTGCAGASFDASCPSLAPYSAEEQARAADELDTLPPGSVVARMMGDYAATREEIRACRQ